MADDNPGSTCKSIDEAIKARKEAERTLTGNPQFLVEEQNLKKELYG